MLTIRSPVVIDNESRQRTHDDVRERLRDVPGADHWSKEVVVGWPADVISTVARSWGASLIAIGLGRHGRVDRLFGTETAVAVIKRANVPVLAVSADVRSLPLRACAAVDFTRASLAAATLAASLISTDGTLSLVHACAFKGANAQAGDLIDLYRAGARTKLDKAVAEVKRHTRRRVEAVMIDGEPAETILGFAKRERCDLIALGGHEKGLVDRILLGSVRTRVLRGAKCSVLVAPPIADG
jgi:nucleotide-binding universal stress UspA family protein